MDSEQFHEFLTAMRTLSKRLGEQGQEIAQFTAVVKEKKEQGAETSRHNPANKPKISVKLPTYSGELNENVFMWCKQLQTVFKAQGIEDAETEIYYASTALTDGALHWYLNQQKEDGGLPWENWKEFEEALQNAFQPPHYQKYLRKQLYQLKQTGSALKYVTDFRNIVEQVKDMSETDKIMTFMEGLRPATQAEVDYHMPERLEEAMKMAINYDNAHFRKPSTSKAVAKTSQKKERIVYVPPRLETSSHETTEPMDLDSINRSKEHTKKKSNKPSSDACYRCGKTGHIARNCKDKTSSTKEKSVVVSSAEGDTERKKNNVECKNVTKPRSESIAIEDQRERLIRFDGTVNNQKAWILLDSGSALNFIDKSFVERQHLKYKNIEPFTVELADGTKKTITQNVFIWKLNLGEYRAKGITAHVIDLQRYDVILGKPWLYFANPVVDWRKNTLTFN